MKLEKHIAMILLVSGLAAYQQSCKSSEPLPQPTNTNRQPTQKSMNQNTNGGFTQNQNTLSNAKNQAVNNQTTNTQITNTQTGQPYTYPTNNVVLNPQVNNQGTNNNPAYTTGNYYQTPANTNPNASQGSGGALGYAETNFQSTAGLRSSYKINAPSDIGPNKPYGLHVHLHGDGGGGYKDFPNRQTTQNLVGVAVKAPNQGQTWGRSSGVAHARFLNELLQNEILRKYNIDRTRIYFSGVSGGAYFLAGHFIPMYGSVYTAGAMLLCGGMSPEVNFTQPEFLRTFRLHWQITAGERQDILGSVRPAISAYQRLLAQAGGNASMQTSEIVGQGGHCEFDGQDYTSGIQYMLDLKFNTIIHN